MKAFYSYCHKDERWLEIIRQELHVTFDSADIEQWWDRELVGSDHLKSIEQHMEQSDILLLLITTEYLNSDACRKEMEFALEENAKSSKLAVPILVKSCGWEDIPALREVLALPQDAKPAEDWASRSRLMDHLRSEVRKVIKKAKEREARLRQYSDFLTGLQQIEFISQNKFDVVMDDVFVFPNLTIDTEGEDQELHSFTDLWMQRSRILLHGGNRSGKTTLCNKIVLQHIDTETGALLLDASVPVQGRRDQWIRDLCKVQIKGGHLEWRQKTRRLLIVDNLNRTSNLEFLRSAEKEFDQVLLACDEEDYICGLRARHELSTYIGVRLGPLRHAQQEDLIRNWLRVGNADALDDTRVDQLEKDVNLIIQENRVVPRYPFFVLSILQTHEGIMPQRMDITAYGHCYQALITAQLVTEGIDPKDIDSAQNVLTELSYSIFNESLESGEHHIDLHQFIDAYTREYIVKPTVIERLYQRGRVLVLQNERCSFKFGFIYYFFLGKYIASHYSENKDLVENLCRDSHLHHNAYTLIFTAHHTINEDLVETIVLNTMLASGDRKPATLNKSETVAFAQELSSLSKQIAKDNAAVSEHRREERERRDAQDSRSRSEDDELERLYESSMYRSLRNMEILGQVLRNRYGSLKKRTLEEIADAIISCGLCLVHDFTSEALLQNFRDYIAGLADSEIRDKKYEVQQEELIRKLGKELGILCFAIIMLLLETTVSCIEKRELSPMIQSLRQQKKTPAYHIIDAMFSVHTRGIKHSADVDQLEELVKRLDSEGNDTGKHLVARWCYRYLATHHVKFDLRQRTYSLFRYLYQPNKRELHT